MLEHLLKTQCRPRAEYDDPSEGNRFDEHIQNTLTNAVDGGHAGAIVAIFKHGVPVGVIRDAIEENFPAAPQAAQVLINTTLSLSLLLLLLHTSRRHYFVDLRDGGVW